MGSVESVLESLFQSTVLRRAANEAGAASRVHMVDVVSFFWTLVLGFGVSKERTLAGPRWTCVPILGFSEQKLPPGGFSRLTHPAWSPPRGTAKFF